MLVSILIPNYNYGRYIQCCVDSALAQTYRPVEVIVYDDGSTDESVQILRQYGDRIRLVLARNHGRGHAANQVHAINRAFEVSSGDIVCLLDSDDEFTEDKVARIVSVFQRHPNVVAVENLGVHVDASGAMVGLRDRGPPLTPADGYVTRQRMLEDTYRHGFPFAGLPTSFLSFRRSYLERVMPLAEDEFDACFVDARLSSMVPLHGDYYVLSDRLTRYRVHGGNNFHGKSVRLFLRCMVQTCRFYNRASSHAGMPPVRYYTGIMMRRMVGHALRWTVRQWRRSLRRGLHSLVGANS